VDPDPDLDELSGVEVRGLLVRFTEIPVRDAIGQFGFVSVDPDEPVVLIDFRACFWDVVTMLVWHF
jgi:hypothetical protein